MTDCEGKEVQVGDEVITWGNQYRVGKHVYRGIVTKITKAKIGISRIPNTQVSNSYIRTHEYYFPREVYKL